MREASTSYFGEDIFLLDAPIKLPSIADEKSLLPPPPEYEIGYGDLSATMPEPDYKLLRGIGVTLLVGIVIIVVILIVWYIFNRLAVESSATSSADTTATHIQNFMNSVNTGGYHITGTASGLRRGAECVEANNCSSVVTPNGTIYNCFVDPFTTTFREWLDITCTLPNITPFFTSLSKKLTNEEFLNLGVPVIPIEVGSTKILAPNPTLVPVYYDPFEANKLLTDFPELLAVIYDTTDELPSSTGSYGSYFFTSKSTTQPVIDVSGINQYAIPFSSLTKTQILFVKTPQNLFFGDFVTLSYLNEPILTDLMTAPNANTITIDPGTSFLTNNSFELFNLPRFNLLITSSAKITNTNTQFIPYGNLTFLNTTIQVSPPTAPAAFSIVNTWFWVGTSSATVSPETAAADIPPSNVPSTAIYPRSADTAFPGNGLNWTMTQADTVAQSTATSMGTQQIYGNPTYSFTSSDALATAQGTTNTYLVFDLGISRDISFFIYRAPNDLTPGAWTPTSTYADGQTLQYWNGSTWENLITIGTGFNPGETRTYVFPQVTTQYYRLQSNSSFYAIASQAAVSG